MPLSYSKRPELLFRDLDKFKRDIPRIAGNEAVRFFKESFKKQGWDDGSLDKWAKRKTRTGRPTDNRAVLIKSGALRRSIRIVRFTRNAVIVSTELPYAAIHNEGGQINKTVSVRSHIRRMRSGTARVTSHSRKMNLKIDKRKFMGQSDTLDNIILNDLERRLRQTLNR